jgi:hypothetical protein
MLSLYQDPDDPWNRFVKQLRDRITEYTEILVRGELDQRSYDAYCGRIESLKWAIEAQRSVRRGDDIRPMPKAEPLLSPEC